MGGAAKTVLSGYYKFGCATLLGDTFGTSGTAVMEIYEDTDKYGQAGTLQDHLRADGTAFLGELPRTDGERRVGHADDLHNGD